MRGMRLLWVGFLDFAFWLTRLRGDTGTRRKISERKNRFFQTEYEKPTLERGDEGDVVRLRSPTGGMKENFLRVPCSFPIPNNH
jgi:hypothetical protein